jgi:nitroreductase
MEKIDSCPMEGFNNVNLDEILQLKERGLKSVALLALGYRNEELDMLAKAKKVRREKDKLFISLQSSIGFNVSNIFSII